MARRTALLTVDPPTTLGSRSQPRPRAHRHRWRLLLWRVRFPFAAVFLGAAAAQVVAELSPPPPWTVAVVVAKRDLLPGGTLAAQDVRVVHLPGALVPSGSRRHADEVTGRTPVVAIPAGLPIVEQLLAGESLATSGPPGTVVAPVRLADPAVAALLRPGDRIDLLAAAGTADGEPAARQLAARALVLADPTTVSSADERRTEGLFGVGGAEGTAGALTLVAVTPGEAAALAGSAGWSDLSAVIVK